MQEIQVRSLCWEDPLKKEMVTYSSILAWENPMDKGAWGAAVHGVSKELDTSKHVSISTWVSSVKMLDTHVHTR